MPELPRTFSHSSASLFKQCPRRWKHKYIDKLPDPAGEAALVGQFAHDVLEQLCKEDSALRTEVKANEIARSLWPKIAERKDFKNLKLNSEEEDKERLIINKEKLLISKIIINMEPRNIDSV